jgi:hypothetical protein
MAGQRFNSGQVSNWGRDVVPSGGSKGQVLEKKSGTNYDVVWGGASNAVLQFSADYLAPPHGRANISTADGRLTALMVLVPSGGMSCDALQLSCASGNASAICRLGIYSSNANNLPDTLIVDAGTVDVSSGGLKTATFGAVTVPGGIVWVVAKQTGAAATLVCTSNAAVSYDIPMPQGSSEPGSTSITGLSASGQTAGTFATTWALGNTRDRNCVIIGLRYA